MMRTLFSRLLFKFFGMSGLDSRAEHDHEAELVTPSKRKPNWTNGSRRLAPKTAASGASGVKRQKNSGLTTDASPEGSFTCAPKKKKSRKRARKRERRRVFDNSFS